MIRYRLIAKQIVSDGFESNAEAEMAALKLHLRENEWEQWEVEEYEVDEDEMGGDDD